MKINSLVIVSVLAIAILCFGVSANAQTSSVQALIAQLQARIASLMAQIKTLQARQQVSPSSSVGLVYDSASGIYMEQNVLNEVNTVRTNTGVCDNCNNLPQPTISLNNGTLPAIYNLYLNNKNVTKFPLPSLNASNSIVDNAGNVLSVTYRTFVNGTNSIKFLIPSAGNYFQNENTILTPNQTTNVNYKIIKKQGQYGSAYFFTLENDSTINLDKTSSDFDAIAKKESTLAGLATVDPYYIIAMPPTFALSLGAEGDFYMGQHLVTINYGGNLYYQTNPQIFNNEQAHEYTHGLQETLNLNQKYTDASFLMEGMADTVAIYSGFRNWSDVGLGGQINPGCSNTSGSADFVHDFGRCIFKHLSQDNYLNSNFFNKLFNPTQTFDFSKCSYNNPSASTILQNQDCANQINKLLSYLTGQDMTQFMKNDLLANVASCTPNWTCGAWSNCANGIQMRVCSDSNNCNINTGKPAESQSCVYSCNDSDSGIDYNNYGTVTFSGKTYSDWCSTNNGNGGYVTNCSGLNCTLIEQYCDSTIGGVNYKSNNCPNGCSNGACKAACNPNWTCGSWSNCSNNKQMRVCTDSNNCNSIIGKPAESQSCVYSCNDSDSGIDYNNYGTVTYGGNSYSDWCSTNNGNGGQVSSCSGPSCTLIEQYCDSTIGGVNYKSYVCPNGCLNGACNANQTTTCTDSDGGENYYVKGTLTGIYNGAPISLDDFCIDRTNSQNGAVVGQCSGSNCQVGERVCNSSNPTDYGTKYYTCPNSCTNGACIQQASFNVMQNNLASISNALKIIIQEIQNLFGH